MLCLGGVATLIRAVGLESRTPVAIGRPSDELCAVTLMDRHRVQTMLPLAHCCRTPTATARRGRLGGCRGRCRREMPSVGLYVTRAWL